MNIVTSAKEEVSTREKFHTMENIKIIQYMDNGKTNFLNFLFYNNKITPHTPSNKVKNLSDSADSKFELDSIDRLRLLYI
jgi:hypothetical protein